MLLGIVVLAIAAAAVTGIDGWRFFAVGALAALAAAAGGGALGLLFGLPISNQVILAARRTTAGQSEDRNAEDQGGAGTEWFRDNTSMEQIADWLTKIIVGLTLTQWSSFQESFDRMAGAVTAAMMPVASPPAAAATPLDAGKVAGGLILAAYAILGFLLVYLWARRYLSGEFAFARGAQRKIQQESDEQFLSRARDQQGIQVARKDTDAAELASQAVERAQANPPLRFDFSLSRLDRVLRGERPGAAAAAEFPELLRPGKMEDDPWKGVFGGKPSDGQVGISAAVRKLDDSEYFALEVTIGGLTGAGRQQVRGRPARIYLHPTFPNSIRLANFDDEGAIRLALVAYGAFTLGVQLWDGRLFELDLAELPDAPRAFRES